jgi:hypothetical protein
VIERLCMFIAWWLPRRLVYWCAIRVGCHATQGRWSEHIATDLLFMDAISRWKTPK